MGHVYLARSTGLGGFERHVVVKLLDVSGEDDDLVAMFLDEARVLGALHHQFIAPIYDVGRDSDGRYFLVMEYVRGETATQVIQALQEAGSGASLPLALSVVAAIASALDYAHDVCAADGTPLEIVHRDVSPSNIMIGHEGDVKLIDFGIAKFAHRTSQTQIGSLKGKLGHLSPEQILHEQPVDRRADIFSLGIVLYELTTLTRAFEGASELIILEKIIHGHYVAPSKVVRDYPPDLERIVRKAMAVDPDRRYQDAGAFGRELEAFAARHGVPIGHGAVRDEMTRLFSGPSTRRRFPRASSEVSTGRLPSLPPPDDIDADITPVEPIEMLEVEPEPSVPVDVPTEMILPIEVAPVVVRIATRPPTPPAAPAPVPMKVGTVTAELPKKPASHLRWWLPLLVIVVAVAAALVVAHW